MDIDSVLAENAALKRKLQSKSEALLILNKELTKYIDENKILKNANSLTDSGSLISQFYQFNSDRVTQCCQCSHQVASLQRENTGLRLQVDELKQELNSAHGDIKVLRRDKRCCGERDSENWHGREALVSRLEEACKRVKQLESDLTSLLDERQEVVSERDQYRCKVHRLNHQISSLLSAPSSLDVDALLVENKCLHDRLDQAQADKELIQHNLSKYKNMLDKKRNKGAVQIGTVASCEGMIVTHKQVEELLEGELKESEATVADLRSLCQAMLDSLQDKSLALAHHKKTTKLLAGRISDLEALLSKNSGDILYPSKRLMEGYSSAQVDKDLPPLSPHHNSDNSLEKEVNNHLGSESKSDVKDDKKVHDGGLPPHLQELVSKAIRDIESSEESRDNTQHL